MTEENVMGGKEGFVSRNDRIQGLRGQVAVVDPQLKSLLFQRLPQEIRDYIYRTLFFSTTCIPERRQWCERTRLALNSLALLRVCRRAKLEIGNSCSEAMLDHLYDLPADTLSRIRHISVRSEDVQLVLDTGISHYPLVSVFKLLPGLRLDQLTVLDKFSSERSYNTLERLIVESNGWKTLRYVCRGSDMLGFSSCLYRGTERTKILGIGTVLDPRKRVKFVQKSWEGSNCKPGVFPEDPELMTMMEQCKEMLVIVKRGSGVDYEQKKDSPFAECDLDFRRDYPGMTWSQIFAQSHRAGRQQLAWALGLEDRITRPLDATNASLSIR
ncbi:hypothetical protein F5144DRAFT_623145 [Chaetomium tenue]|uniref:Uncharacterized protein n=1 Tax=Chaetomium tenue TaxID=1854479 RepID=A0ACB7NXH1_9PEZI|nr:hypothetical protein F5144DRAFT_623145 [Chaetomium globosum]